MASPHSKIPVLTIFWRLLKISANSWIENKSARLGAALAFYSVLSLAPLLLLVMNIASFFWGAEAAQGQIVSQMSSIIGEQGAEAIQNILTVSQNNKSTGLIAALMGGATLLFSASGAFGELQDAMNIIWKAKPRQGTVWVLVRERFLSFTMVVGSGFLLLVSLLLSAWLAAAAAYMRGLLPDFIILMRLLDFIVGFGVVSFLFALAFKVVPDLSIRWRSVWPGGMLTAFLFIVGKMAISFYLTHTNLASTYGKAGSFVVLLVWVYYSAQILFFGAEFTRAYSEYFNLHRKRSL